MIMAFMISCAPVNTNITAELRTYNDIISSEDWTSYKDWSVSCNPENCWLITNTHLNQVVIATYVKKTDNIVIGAISTNGNFSESDAIQINAKNQSAKMKPRALNAFIADQRDHDTTLANFIKGNRAELRVNGVRHQFSLSGYTAALKHAHRNTGRNFDYAALTRPKARVSTTASAQSRSEVSNPGCGNPMTTSQRTATLRYLSKLFSPKLDTRINRHF